MAEDKRQAVHQQLSQCQLGRDNEHVRKNASRGGNKVTLPRDVLEPLPSAGVSFSLCISTEIAEGDGLGPPVPLLFQTVGEKRKRWVVFMERVST